MERTSMMEWPKALYEKDYRDSLIQNRNFLFKCPRWSYTDHGLQVLPISTQPQQQALRQQLQSAQAELRLAEAELKEVQAKQTTTVKDVSLEQTLLLSQLTEVETKIQELGVVRAPYEGLIKNIKWLGQSDQTLTAEITISLESLPQKSPEAPSQKQSEPLSTKSATSDPQPSTRPPELKVANVPATLWEVVKIHDGDTMRVRSGGENLKIRFACIDAPELKQPLGIESRDYLRELVAQAGNQVRLKVTDRDRYGRSVAEVFLPDGSFVQALQTTAGVAYVYRRYLKSCPDSERVIQGETAAKQANRGIWHGQHQPPWEYRKSKRR